MQQQQLYMAFIDLTKTFDLVSRKGLFTLYQKIACPPMFLGLIISSHEDMQRTVWYDFQTRDPFPIKSNMK